MTATLLVLASLLASGHTALRPVATPIATGPRYQPAAAGHAVQTARPVGMLICRPDRRTRRMAHVELFVHGRAVLLPAGIGVAPPLRGTGDGRATGGLCTYPLSTHDPTGVIDMTGFRRFTLAQLFQVWDQRLGAHRLLSFRSAAPVRAWVDGRRWRGAVRGIPLRDHSEIVVELGRRVPPHSFYLFPVLP
jgi:hypothetical protein